MMEYVTTVSRNFTFEAYPRRDTRTAAWQLQFAGLRHAYNLVVRACRDEDERNALRKAQGLAPEYLLSAGTFTYAWFTARSGTALVNRQGQEYFPLQELPYRSALNGVADRAFRAYRAVLARRAAGEPAQLRFKSCHDDQSCTWQVQCCQARRTPRPDQERYAAQLRKDGSPKLRAKDDPQGRWRKGDPYVKDTGAFNWKAFPDDLITVTGSPGNRGKSWAVLKVPVALGAALRFRMHRPLPPGTRTDSVTVKYRAADDTWWITLNCTFSDEHLEPAAPSGDISADPGVTDSAMFGDEYSSWAYRRRGLTAAEQAAELALRQEISAIRLRYCPCLDEKGKLVRGCRKPGHGDWRAFEARQYLKLRLGKLLRRAADRAVNDERVIARQHARQYRVLYMGSAAGSLNSAGKARAPGDREEGRNYGVAAHTEMNRRIRAARWGELARRHADAGMTVITVDERGTSRTCSACGYVHSPQEYEQARPRAGKRFRCARCGLRVDADVNAQRNILRRGREHHDTEVRPG